ncbi:MAG: fused MFS/spermidine synthase, partial [Bdellovibrionales bacterium]|nr:fused MFS/spermidine synthase [Bdellovibrionales bacterium]
MNQRNTCVRLREMLLIVFCFFLTGFTSLVLEVAWSRAFAPILGSSLYSAATVVGAFMGGLALGAWLISRWKGALTRPMRTFAFLQIVIGIVGTISIPLLHWTSPLYSTIYSMGGEGSALFLTLRFLVVGLQLGLPVTLMGMLLPLASSLFQEQKLEHGSAWTSVLYGATTAGAVLGSVASGFVLLPQLGLTFTCVVVGLIDILVGAVVFVRYRKLSLASTESVGTRPRPKISQKMRGLEWLILVSGFSALSLEISWFRLLANIFGATVHAFSIMLGVFLLGIASGSFAASRLVRHSRYASLEGLYLFGMAGLLALISSAFINELPLWYAQLYWQMSSGESFWGYFFSQLVVTSIVIFPSTFCFGSVFPYLLKIHMGNSKTRSLHFSAGRLYAYNTLGGVLGLLATGLLLLPHFGVSKSLLIATTTMIIASFALAGGYLHQISHRRKFKAVATLSSLSLIAGIALPKHDPLATSQGLFMNMKGQGGVEAFIDERETPVSMLLHFEEGLSGTVAVIANE